MNKPASTVKKSERIVILADPKFKRFLNAEAKREGVSVAELVRSRVEGRPAPEEALLAALTAELNERVHNVRSAVRRTLLDVDAVLAELREARRAREAASPRGRRAHADAPEITPLSEGADA
jgi:hypothetical protein